MEIPTAASSPALSAAAGVAGLAASLWLGYLAISQGPAARATATGTGLDNCRMDRDGYWKGRIFGSSTFDFDWRGDALACAGNARPDGRGLRLFLAGRPGAGPDRLMLVLGISTGIAELAAAEYPASVTLVDESSSHFFHGPSERCFTRIREVVPLAGAPRSWRIEGDLYCAGAIASVTGEFSVTLGDMAFAGRLTLDDE
jgi:hypothetical protein